MVYKIKATFKENTLKEFFKKLTDGTIENQKLDGLEIITSMKRAKLLDEKSIWWYERCFCQIPLNHERTTVYDNYFNTFEPTLVDEIKEDIKGDSFWEYMEKK